jgi:lipoyl(octanoyl) transferase
MTRVWRLINGPGSEVRAGARALRDLERAPPGTGIAVPRLPGAVNMAVDQALLRGVGRGEAPAVRFYGWQPACLSFGRNQRARGVYDEAALLARGIGVVRRPTGGLAVLHDRELTYAVAAPVAELGLPRAAYVAINRALVQGLQSLGVSARLATGRPPPANAPRLDADVPCFASPAPGEVVIGARKLVGSAQCREGRAILQHGSILLAADQGRVSGFLAGGADGRAGPGDGAPPPTGASSSVGLADVMGAVPAVPELARKFAAAFEATLGVHLEPAPLSAAECEMIEALTAQYASPTWTWRR